MVLVNTVGVLFFKKLYSFCLIGLKNKQFISLLIYVLFRTRLIVSIDCKYIYTYSQNVTLIYRDSSWIMLFSKRISRFSCIIRCHIRLTRKYRYIRLCNIIKLHYLFYQWWLSMLRQIIISKIIEFSILGMRDNSIVIILKLLWYYWWLIYLLKIIAYKLFYNTKNI